MTGSRTPTPTLPELVFASGSEPQSALKEEPDHRRQASSRSRSLSRYRSFLLPNSLN
jgi:hypothetical protein